MNKKLMVFGLVGLLSLNIQAQVKKTPAKPATAAKKPAATAPSGGINASNYGKVIQYLNSTIDCMNAQGTAIADRSNNVDQMYGLYVTRDAKDMLGNKTTNFSPSRIKFNYADEKASQECVDAKPPTIMKAEDITFYSTNYPAVREAFIAITKHWNDIGTSVDKNGWSNYTLDEGKKKCEELIAAIDHYYALRKSMSTRTRGIQKALFPYSVAKSPDKKQYINMNDDLTAIQDFAANITSYEEIQSNKAAIAAALSVIEDAAIKHGAEMPSSNMSQNYKSFYSYIDSYISHTKQLLNGTIRERDRQKELDRSRYHYKGIITQYNFIMSL